MTPRIRSAECGQAALLMLGVLAALARGHADPLRLRPGTRGTREAPAGGRRRSPRLFEPAVLEDGVPNPRHLSNGAFLSLARSAALRGAQRNGVAADMVSVEFPKPALRRVE
jgi:hypothetical protein